MNFTLNLAGAAVHLRSLKELGKVLGGLAAYNYIEPALAEAQFALLTSELRALGATEWVEFLETYARGFKEVADALDAPG